MATMVNDNGWKTIRLGDVCTKIGSGATPRGGKDVYMETGRYALVRSQNVYNDRFRREGLAFIGERHAAELNNVEVMPGDVLLNITGDSVARVCQVDDSILPARVNQHVAIIRADPGTLDNRFLRYALVTQEMQLRLLSWAGAGATRRALTKAMIESLEVLAPADVSEQRAIAHILGTLDDKIELLRRMNETLEAIARAIFKSWFVHFDPVRAKAEGREPYGMDAEMAALFPDAFEDSPLGNIPKGWEVGRLGDVIDIHDSRRIPLSSRERAERRGPYPYYGATSVMDYVDDFLFEGVYVLMAEDGSVADDFDHPVLQYVWGQFWVNNHAHVLTGRSGVTQEHLFVALHEVNVRPFVTGAVQPKLSQGNLKRIPMVIAPAAVNAAYGQSVETLFSRYRLNVEESRTLAELRDTLLPKLLSGEVRVNWAKLPS